MNKFKFTAILLSLCFSLISQNRDNVDISDIYLNVINSFRHYNLKKLDQNFLDIKDNDLRKIFKWKFNSLTRKKLDSFPLKKVDLVSISNYKNALISLFYGDYLQLNGADPAFSYDYYLKVEDYALKTNDSILICEALKRIISQINLRERNKHILKNSIQDYQSYSYDKHEKNLSFLFKIRAESFIQDEPYIDSLFKGLKIAKKTNDTIVIARYYKLIGVKYDYYAEKLKKDNPYSKAIKFYDSSLVLLKNYSNNFVINQRVGININKGIVFLYMQKYDSAHFYLDLGKSLMSKNDKYHNILYNHWSSETYADELKFDSAYARRSLETDLLRKDTYKKAEINIAQTDRKYQTAEKEKQNLILTAEKKRNQNIAIGLGGSLLLGSIIAFLLYRSTKRKQRIAEQEKELEIQKTAQILKEKEVETINAMVEGQEKERLRLAGELHDNLGSTLATVKMQVENLERNLEKVDDPKGLLSKTNTLINEAYQKVRRISHERNSGVMAKEGLLPAVQKLAKQISSSGPLQIEVQDFGLENRLSNHLEITIFRIIQELTTNIVKHAQATEASISLTQHDNELNIIVEDNGKGFKVGKLEQKDGMGLGSIERRVEHLEGSMEVDSTLGKGTNIIIDIPLETSNDNPQVPNEI